MPHGTVMALYKDINFLGPPQKEHDETYANGSLIKSEIREIELWFLMHHHHSLDDEDTTSKGTLTNDLDMAYNDVYNKSQSIVRIGNRFFMHPKWYKENPWAWKIENQYENKYYEHACIKNPSKNTMANKYVDINDKNTPLKKRILNDVSTHES